MRKKDIKHYLMLFLRKISNDIFEYVRFFIFTQRIPSQRRIRTMSEFLLRKKLQRHFVKPELAGKLEAYSYVKKNFPSVRTPNVLCTIDNTEEKIGQIGYGNYIMKASHGSGYFQTFSVSETISSYDLEELNRYAQSWLKKKYYAISGEFVYRYVKQKVFIEESVLTDTSLANDIKIHCNDGDAVIVQQIARQTGTLIRHTWVHENGKLQIIDMYKHDNRNDASLNISTIMEAVNQAEELSKGLGYVRVDFIVSSSNELYFIEYTFFPAGGTMPLRSFEHDQKFMNLLERNRKLK